MSRERLNELVILSIEKEILGKLEYKGLISNFAYQRARKTNFKLKNHNAISNIKKPRFIILLWASKSLETTM